MNLYYGDNNSHEFWEDETGDYIIIRHHGHDSWFALNVAGKGVDRGFGMAKRPQTIANRIQRHYGIALQLNHEQRWISKRKNAKRMVLVRTESVKSFNCLSEPCADCGVKPNREHAINCKGGNHSLEATTTDK